MAESGAIARPTAWVGALVLTAAGLWCTRGLLDIVGGPSGAIRVAMLPPWWLLVAAVVVLGAIGWAAAHADRDVDAVLPLCALGLLAVPYLPWLPDRMPVLRSAAGPARDLLWIVVFWLVGCRGVGRLRFRVSVARASLLIFLASAIIFGIVGWRLTHTPLFPGGDEPHYLVITQSLLEDGDLKIENNHQREDYRPYYGRPLKPDYLTRGVDGQIYSVHPVGLPVLAVPAFAAGGYRGVVALLVLMAALAALLLWQWMREITGSMSAATFAWAAAALTAPYLFNTFTVYPEIPGALAVMAAIAWRPESTSGRVMLLRGAAIGALPWLSTKYAPMAAAVTLVVLLRARWDVRAMAAVLAPIGAAFAGWFAFFYWIWGTVSPSAPYGTQEPMTLGFLARGAPGLLFDQEYGVMASAPVLAIAFVGLAQMLRSGGAAARRAMELVVIFCPLLFTVGAFHIWWGGSASPGRPVASGVLLLGPPIASFFASTKERPSARAACQVLLAASLAIACALVVAQDGALLHNDRDGSATFLDWVSPTWPLWPALPSFIAGSFAGAIGRTLAWLALGTAAARLAHRLRPLDFGAAALALLLLGSAGALILSSVVGTLASTATPAPEARARVPLLDGFDPGRRPTTILYDPLSRITPADALSRLTLIARPGLRKEPQPIELLWNARFALPAGEYRVRLVRAGAASASSTTVALQVGRVGLPLERWDVTGAQWEHRFVLPIDAQLVGFRAPADVSRGDGELQIAPVRVVDERKRIARPPVISTARYGASTAFFHDDLVSAEATGFWTLGRARAQMTFATLATGADSPATIDVVVGCGPRGNSVTLKAPGWEQRLVFEPGATRPVSIPTVALPELGVRLAPLEISAQEGFVPAEIDRASTDRRFLGCRIDMGQAP